MLFLVILLQSYNFFCVYTKNMLFLHGFCQIFKNEKFNFNIFLRVMKKILLIAAIAVAAMGCCKKATCQQDKCCDKPATECCQKAECDKAACPTECQKPDSCCQKPACCPKAECPKAATCEKKAACEKAATCEKPCAKACDKATCEKPCEKKAACCEKATCPEAAAVAE